MKLQKLFQKCILGVLTVVLFVTAVSVPENRVFAVGTRCSSDLDSETALRIEQAGTALQEIIADREIMALVYLADTYPVRTTPSPDGDVAVNVLSGQLVMIQDIYVDGETGVWEYVELEYDEGVYHGYIPRVHLAVSDSRFLQWEETYGMNPDSVSYTMDESGQIRYADIETFPESYRPALLALKQKHPAWTFVKMNTTLDWESVIYSQLQDGKSLVYKTLPDWAKNGLYDTGNWYYATEAAVKVYMDPRNSLSEDAIFQFEQLTYNEENHTLDAIRAFLNNTFMNDSKPLPGQNDQSTMTFAELFWNLGKEEVRNVSPFHLAARVLQEQGQGNSALISGTYPGYEGYYNFFNIGATGNTDQKVIESGLQYAKEHGWTGAYSAIKGGADFISTKYIQKGQDSLYLQKFNVNPHGYYPPNTHQYMQNITAPTTEAQKIRKLYASANSVESTFVFKIPVFENMPARPCAVPGTEGPVEETFDITLALPAGYDDTTVWLDGVACEGTIQDGRITVTARDKTALSAVIYKYNESGVPKGMYVWSLRYDNGAYVPQPEPELEDLLTYHGFSIRITGKSGIRFKTGISEGLKGSLTSSGVNGYRLQEYGTLVMNNANRVQYPMIKDGAKVQSGMAYGTDANGGSVDVVYETVEGRHRYTSVLVGMPTAQYKTEFAFRGYIILEKNGRRVTLYGPPVAKSIYSLAQQLLDRGSYEQGSETYEFLTKLISDAD